MNGWKALVWIVGIGAFVWLTVYIVKEVKECIILQRKTEAISDIVKESAEFVTSILPRKD